MAGYELATGEPMVFHAKAVLLATGGCGRIFQTTSMSFAATGDGFALAFDAGVPLEDMEFVQFHPTGIHGLGILVSEAARAEGGMLRNGKGERFMERYAPTLKDLAPRDIISRAILTEVAEGRGVEGSDYVYLDLTHLGKGPVAGETFGSHVICEDISRHRRKCITDSRCANMPLHDGRHAYRRTGTRTCR